MSLLEDRKAE